MCFNGIDAHHIQAEAHQRKFPELRRVIAYDCDFILSLIDAKNKIEKLSFVCYSSRNCLQNNIDF